MSTKPGQCQIVELLHEGRPLTVATTHLRYDPPARARAEKVGLRQVRELMEMVESAGSALVVCGDFNVGADSAVTATLREHGLLDAYAGCDDAFTCNANGRCQRIDYICHGEAFSAQPRPIPAISDQTPLPSTSQPSDHLAIVACLRWNEVG